VRVHPHILESQKLPPGKRGKSFWDARYDDINAFERHLARNGTLILKFFLNVSKAEQKRRFLDRLEDPEKHWKFSAADLAERGYWDDYMEAFEDMLNATTTQWAPWHVIPADHKFVTRALVSAIVTGAVRELGLEYPKVAPEQEAQLREAREKLLAEP
jgi:polyphosphate kinase 2 (PPK2 family)